MTSDNCLVVVGRRSLVKSNATRTLSCKRPENGEHNSFMLCRERPEKRESCVFCVVETCIDTLVWVVNCVVNCLVRHWHRRPPQTVNILPPCGTSHQRKYLGSPTPVRPVASPPQIRTHELGHGTNRSQYSSHQGRGSSAKTPRQRYSKNRNGKRKFKSWLSQGPKHTKGEEQSTR